MDDRRVEIALDVSKTCRLCLSSSYELVDMFIVEGAVSLATKIMSFVSVQIISTDIQPRLVCPLCLQIVETCFKFKQLCENADNILRKLVNNEIIDCQYLEQIQEDGRDIKKMFHWNQSNEQYPAEHFSDLDTEERNQSTKCDINVEQCSDSHNPLTTPRLRRLVKTINGTKKTQEKKQLLSKGNGKKMSMDKGKHLCKTCGQIYYSESELLVHIFSEHKMSKNKCFEHKTDVMKLSDVNNVVHDNYDAITELPANYELDSNAKNCDECGLLFSNESELLVHKYTEHLGRRSKAQKFVRCPDCEERYPGTKSLYDHIRKMHKFRCPDCNDGFATAELMDKHLLELGPHKENFVCQDCGLMFDDRRKLKEHMRKKVKCDMCEKVFSSSQRLVEHKVIKHGIGTKKEYQCEICGKGFPYYSSLRYHKRTHGEKNIVCPICGQRFHFACNYNVHVNLHHSRAEDNVICDVCGEMVPKHKMRNHLTRHAQPSLPCDLCGKMFRFKGQLKRHKVRFHKDTPHPCPFCRKGFVKGENLKAHVAKAHEFVLKDPPH